MNSFFERRYIIIGIFVTVALILLARLAYIQLVDDRYLLNAYNNVLRKKIIYPARGFITDRNGKILVGNQYVYDITVTPKLVKPIDTAEFCRLIGIDKAGFIKRMQKAVNTAVSLPSTFEAQLPANLYYTLQERMTEFPGFDIQKRSVRRYPDSCAAHFLGYIGEANQREIKRSGGYYRQGDYVGISGVERSYETELRGQRGVQYLLVDSHGVPKGHFLNGANDTLQQAGERLTSSLDIRIQKLGERLMKNKVGSIVAIEPSTGEILCYVSSPTYDPNLLVGRERGNNVAKLYADPYNPFYNRPIQARYPPGSSFKPLSALIALQESMIVPGTSYNCPGKYLANNGKPKCTHVHGFVTLSSAIAESCNGYFSMVFERLINAHGGNQTDPTFTDWRSKVNKFGLGSKLGVDLPNENKGNLPTALYYDNHYGYNHWRSKTVLSLAIGQGEVEATPLQLANIECTIANRGFFYKPHLIKSIGDKNVIKQEYTVKNDVGIDPQYFEPVINGMQQVVEYGTARASKIPGIVMCGKTGTAQNPHGKNHSLFVAFAPRENPKIAIAVIVENSGDGGTYAAPIASFIVEKYLKDSISYRGQGFTPEYYAGLNLMPELKPKAPAPVKLPLNKADSLKKAASDSSKKAVLRTAAAKKARLANYLALQLRRKEHE